MATRIQLSRAKGWRKPEGAVVVARPSRWGNPYRPIRQGDGTWVPTDDNGVEYLGYGPFTTRSEALRDCVRLFAEIEVGLGLLADRADVSELAGRDVACWCPADELCHGDVLLRLADALVDTPQDGSA